MRQKSHLVWDIIISEKGKGERNMGQVVYIDLLFLVDFSMDFLCFFVTARLLHRPFRLWRCMIAAAMGGIYSVGIIFLKLNTFLGLIADLGFCILMCLCAFGIKNMKLDRFLLCSSVYFGVSMGTGGCMTAMYSLLNKLDLPFGEVENNPDGISVWLFGLLALFSGIVALKGGQLFKNVSNDTVSAVDITYMGACLRVIGMTDTGNMLKDPISGRAVLIVDAETLKGLLSEKCINSALVGDISGVISDNPGHRVRLISMHTASGSSMSCAFIPDKMMISAADEKGNFESPYETDLLFAPAHLSLTKDRRARGCAALIPGEITYR